MAASLPAPSLVLRALEIYLRLAYEGSVPEAVRVRVAELGRLPDDQFFASPSLERDSRALPNRLSLRLGNRRYPHMKLTIEESPDHGGYLFRADTHDRHICPAANSRDYEAFSELMRFNQALASAIEAAWAQERLPTFKTFLRDDLARRQAASRNDVSA